MFELIKSSLNNLYKINHYLLFLLLTYLFIHKTIDDLLDFLLQNISLPIFSLHLFVHLYIVILVSFFFIEVLQNFIDINPSIQRLVWDTNDFIQYIYLFICFHSRKIILPPMENDLIVFIFFIAIFAFIKNNFIHLCKEMTKNFKRYNKWEIISLFVFIAISFTLQTNWIAEGIAKFQVERLIELCQKLS